jgi:two-component system cell cycle sensor histidine kinase/response regulator CckA
MDRPSHTDPAPDLHTLQVQVLYRNMPTGVLASAINAAVLAAVEWSVVPHTPLLLWVVGLWMVARRAGTPDPRLSASAAGLPGAAQTGTAGCWSPPAWRDSDGGSSVYFLTLDIPPPL